MGPWRSDDGGKGTDRPEGDRYGPPLHERADSEPGQAGDLVREIDLPLLLELGQVALVGDRVEHLLGVGGGQVRGALDRTQGAVHPCHGRGIDLEVQVGALALNDVAQRCIDLERHRRPYRAQASATSFGCFASHIDIN